MVHTFGLAIDINVVIADAVHFVNFITLLYLLLLPIADYTPAKYVKPKERKTLLPFYSSPTIFRFTLLIFLRHIISFRNLFCHFF